LLQSFHYHHGTATALVSAANLAEIATTLHIFPKVLPIKNAKITS